jgi:hypothetical protein
VWSVTTHVRLIGAGADGLGEDISLMEEDGTSLHEARPALGLEGEWTLASFCDHLAALELVVKPPEWEGALRFRNWAFESAALDLSLRQAGRSLHGVLGLPPQPVRFVNSLGLGKTPSIEPVRRRLARSPGVRFGCSTSTHAARGSGDRCMAAAWASWALAAGRGQIGLLAALFHADAPNDVAPSAYNEDDPPAACRPARWRRAPRPPAFAGRRRRAHRARRAHRPHVGTATSTRRRSGASTSAGMSPCATAPVSGRTRAPTPKRTRRGEAAGASSAGKAGVSSLGARRRKARGRVVHRGHGMVRLRTAAVVLEEQVLRHGGLLVSWAAPSWPFTW